MLKKLLLSAVATMVALAIGELLVRALCNVPAVKQISASSSNSIYQRSSNPLLSYELKPNYHCAKPNLISEYESTNSHGQRDLERSLEKPPGKSRVILLGDSVVEGHGIRETETISRQLGMLLQDENVEVLNFGVSGYCTRAEVELLEGKGLTFHPDIVVLVFSSNDFDNFNREAFILGRDRPGVVKYLFTKSHLFRIAALELNLFQYGAEADPGRWNRRAIGENNVVSGLRRLSQLSRQHNFRVLVGVWPTFDDAGIVNDQFMPGGGEDLIVERLSRMYQIPVVRLSEDFQRDFSAEGGSASPRVLYTIGDKMHPSPRGSLVAAHALRKHLASLKEGKVSVAQTEVKEDPEAIAAAASFGGEEPNKSIVFNNLGLGLLLSGKYERSIEYFEQSLHEDPKFAIAHFNWGTALNALGRHEEAISHFQEAVRLKPEPYAQAHLNWGRALNALGRPQEAIEHFQEALRIKPDCADAHLYWGNALGRPQESILHFQEALRINPEFALGHNALGNALNALGRPDEAVAHFEEALRIKPDFALAHYSWGSVLAAQGQFPEAIAHFEQAVRLKPDFAAARDNLHRAQTLLQQRNGLPN